MRLWSAAGGPAVHLHSPPDLLSPPEPCGLAFPSSDSTITRVAISADGRNVVTRSEQGLLQLWPVATGGEPITITCNASLTAASVAVSPDGRKVAAGVYDGSTVRMWDVATGTATTLPGSASYTGDLVFSANGAVLAAESSEGLVRMWQVASGKTLPLITTYSTTLAGLALTPDGTTIATYDPDGIRLLWDVKTGRHVATLPYRAGQVRAATFSPDGNTLATGGESEVQLWHVPELVAGQS